MKFRAGPCRCQNCCQTLLGWAEHCPLLCCLSPRSMGLWWEAPVQEPGSPWLRESPCVTLGFSPFSLQWPQESVGLFWVWSRVPTQLVGVAAW